MYKQEQIDLWRAYKAEGHTAKEVAEHFGIKENTAVVFCKGIAPQHGIITYEARTKRVKTSFPNREAKAIEMIRTYCIGFEYVGGFKNTESAVKLRHLECGCVDEYSYVTIRHGSCPQCKVCADAERKAKEEAKAKAKEEEKRVLAQKREQRRRDEEEERFRKTIIAFCQMCGKTFITMNPNQVCCSTECSKRRANNRKDKRIKKEKKIDHGINAKTLYRKDNGICWICGGKCNLNDYKEVNGTIICGEDYPSVDHVVPVCEGGTDSWDNVKLAHRHCNTLRYAHRLTPLGLKNCPINAQSGL